MPRLCRLQAGIVLIEEVENRHRNRIGAVLQVSVQTGNGGGLHTAVAQGQVAGLQVQVGGCPRPAIASRQR